MDSNSTPGRLVRTNELFDELRQTNAEVKDLIADIKAHPDKYVKVKFSLFKQAQARASGSDPSGKSAIDNRKSQMG